MCQHPRLALWVLAQVRSLHFPTGLKSDAIPSRKCFKNSSSSRSRYDERRQGPSARILHTAWLFVVLVAGPGCQPPNRGLPYSYPERGLHDDQHSSKLLPSREPRFCSCRRALAVANVQVTGATYTANLAAFFTAPPYELVGRVLRVAPPPSSGPALPRPQPVPVRASVPREIDDLGKSIWGSENEEEKRQIAL